MLPEKSLIIREVLTKITMRYLISVRMAVIKKRRDKFWWGCGEKGNFVHYGWECKLVQPLRERVWSFLKKLKIGLSFDPEIPLLCICPNGCKVSFYTYSVYINPLNFMLQRVNIITYVLYPNKDELFVEYIKAVNKWKSWINTAGKQRTRK